MHMWLDYRLREQARSHRGSLSGRVFWPHHRANVGAGLSDRRTAAMAVGQSMYMWLDYRLREQARSHRGSLLGRVFWSHHKSKVGVGLPTMAVGQLIHLCLNGRLREQARSRILGSYIEPGENKKPRISRYGAFVFSALAADYSTA